MTVDWHQLSTGDRTVVLVHGLEDTWQSWTPLARSLPQSVIALDLPWRAGNDYTWHADGTPGQWLDRALSRLPQPVSAIIGHSFGANATLELLSTGRTFDRAALLGPLYQPGLGACLRTESRHALETAIRTGLRLKLGDRPLAPNIVASMELKLVDHVIPRAFPPFFDHLVATLDLDLSTVEVPTLVLAGVTDNSLPPAGARALAERMPSAEVRLHDHYSHFCHLEQTGDVAAELNEFLCAVVG